MHSCVWLVFQFKPHPELLALIRLHFPFVSSTFRAQPQRGKVTNASFACNVCFLSLRPLCEGKELCTELRVLTPPLRPPPQPIRNKTPPPPHTHTKTKQKNNNPPKKPQTKQTPKLKTHRLHDYVAGCPCTVFHVLLCGDLEETEPT